MTRGRFAWMGFSFQQVYHEMRHQLGLLGSLGGSSKEGNVPTGLEQRALGSNWLMFELLWRDFFRCVCLIGALEVASFGIFAASTRNLNISRISCMPSQV